MAAKRAGIDYVILSAKNGENIEECLDLVVGEVMGKEEGKGEKGKRVKDPELKSLNRHVDMIMRVE